MDFSGYVSMLKKCIKLCDYCWFLRVTNSSFNCGGHTSYSTVNAYEGSFGKQLDIIILIFHATISFPSERDGFHLHFLSILNTNITIHDNGFHSSVDNIA